MSWKKKLSPLPYAASFAGQSLLILLTVTVAYFAGPTIDYLANELGICVQYETIVIAMWGLLYSGLNVIANLTNSSFIREVQGYLRVKRDGYIRDVTLTAAKEQYGKENRRPDSKSTYRTPEQERKETF